MVFDEFIEKSRKVLDEGARKIDEARHSEQATKVRDGAVDGFEKLLHTIIPGQDHNHEGDESQN